MFSHYLYLFLIINTCLFVFGQDDVDLNSVHIGWTGTTKCTRDQKNKIMAGWDDAMTLANMVKGSIDYTAASEQEFLGPSQFIDAYKGNIQAIFDNTATMKRNIFSTWFIYVSCED